MSMVRNESNWYLWAMCLLSTDGIELVVYGFSPLREHRGSVGVVGLVDVDSWCGGQNFRV